MGLPTTSFIVETRFAESRLDCSGMRAVVVASLMQAGDVIVREATAQQTSEMPFIDHDDVIGAGCAKTLDHCYGCDNLKSNGGGDGRQLGAARVAAPFPSPGRMLRSGPGR